MDVSLRWHAGARRRVPAPLALCIAAALLCSASASISWLPNFTFEQRGSFFKHNTPTLSGRVLAVCDLDGDRHADLIVEDKDRNGEKVVAARLWNPSAQAFHPAKCLAKVAPAAVCCLDMNGDGAIDIALTSADGDGTVLLSPLSEDITCTKASGLALTAARGACGVSSGILGDLLVTVGNGQGRVFALDTESNVTASTKISHTADMPPMHTSTGMILYIFDTVQTCAVRVNDGTRVFCVSAHITASPSIGDIDGDGEEDILLPVQISDSSFGILVLFHTLRADSPYENVTNVRVPHENFVLVHTGNSPIRSLSVGDIDADGYADAVLVSNGTVQILQSIRCSPTTCGEKASRAQRRFFSSWSVGKFTAKDRNEAETATLVDLLDHGLYDLVITRKEEFDVFENRVPEDPYTLKVLVLSGRCASKCGRLGLPPYGGVTSSGRVSVSWSDIDGSSHSRTVVLPKPQSRDSAGPSHAIVGLGSSPVMIESLRVEIESGGKVNGRTWSGLIPNARLIAVPFPPDNPSSWRLELYVEPSRRLLGVLYVLLTTMAVLMGSVMFLHARERKADRLEQVQRERVFALATM